MIRNLFTLSTFTALLLLSSTVINAANLYRYTNAEGNQAISTSLPPEAAQHGYDILDGQSMRLIERIPPALTAEQIAVIEQQEREQKLVEEQKKKQAIHDRRLLSLYQSEQDIVDAKQRDVAAKKITLEQTKLSLPELNAKLQHYQQQAAEEELGGGITPKTNKAMSVSEQNLSQAKQLIASLEKEIADLNQQYDADLLRLKQLLNR